VPRNLLPTDFNLPGKPGVSWSWVVTPRLPGTTPGLPASFDLGRIMDTVGLPCNSAPGLGTPFGVFSAIRVAALIFRVHIYRGRAQTLCLENILSGLWVVDTCPRCVL
jgi:hypothetical protein